MKPPGGNYKPQVLNVGWGASRQPQPNAASAGDAAHAGSDAAGGAAGGSASGLATGPVSGSAGREDGDYTTARVMTASPAELILIMYEQFLDLIPDIRRNILRGSQAAMEPDAERAQAIVEELINGLDFDVEMSKDIGAVYIYVRNKIMEANVRFDAGIWDHIESVIRQLYEGFKIAAGQLETPISRAAQLANPSIVAGMTYGQRNIREVVVNARNGLKA